MSLVVSGATESLLFLAPCFNFYFYPQGSVLYYYNITNHSSIHVQTSVLVEILLLLNKRLKILRCWDSNPGRSHQTVVQRTF